MQKDYAVGGASLDAVRINHTTPLGGEAERSEFIEEVSSAQIHLLCLYEVRGCQIELLSVQPAFWYPVDTRWPSVLETVLVVTDHFRMLEETKMGGARGYRRRVTLG